MLFATHKNETNIFFFLFSIYVNKIRINRVYGLNSELGT